MSLVHFVHQSGEVLSIAFGNAMSPEIFEKKIDLFCFDFFIYTGKSLPEALIFASTNPQYDDRLFIELQVL